MFCTTSSKKKKCQPKHQHIPTLYIYYETTAVACTEHGDDGVKEVMEGLQLLKHNASRHACYWKCPCCNIRTPDAQAFLDHMKQYHEEVQYACEDTPFVCTKCAQEVVGAHFKPTDPNMPTSATVVCLRCAWDARCAGQADTLLQGLTLKVPLTGGVLERGWSGSLASTEPIDGTPSGEWREWHQSNLIQST